MRAPRLTLASLLFAAACGDDSSNEPGTELGPCVQQQFCESPLQCIDGICVNPDQLGDTGSASDSATGNTSSPSTSATSNITTAGETSMSTTNPSTTTAVDETGGTPEIHCTNDGVGCFCGHSADYGPVGVACSTSTLPSPATCCAGEGWPAYGGCSCWTISCRQLESDICYCGLGQPDPEDPPVGSCSAGTGVCCLDAGFSCTCYAELTQCLEGDAQVASCSAESVACGEGNSSVAACN